MVNIEQNKLDEYVRTYYEVLDKRLISRVSNKFESIWDANDVIRHYSYELGCDFLYNDIENALRKYIEESKRYTKRYVIEMLFDVKDNELFSKELKQKTCINDGIVTLSILSDQFDIIDYDVDNDDTEELLLEHIKISNNISELIEELQAQLL